jgi:diguanylate cyclase (GGDEF)-like protein
VDELFEYLRDVLYSPRNAHIDPDALPPEQRRLAQGLMQLGEYLAEERVFAEGLSRGDLDVALPAPDNPITGELRDLHGSLSHLVWQAEQVTKGDYSQRLDFMGSLSRVFNDMVATLEDRETRLQHEAEVIGQQNDRLGQGQVLHTRLMELMSDWVVVSSLEDGRIFHMNDACRRYFEAHMNFDVEFRQRLRDISSEDDPLEVGRRELVFEGDDGHAGLRLEVSSLPIQWDGEPAIVSILHDVTREREVEYLAYHDFLTGLFNRRHAIERMCGCFANGTRFELAFVDLDGLKYVNDTFGHDVGNAYILDAVRALSDVAGPVELCREGGDEFLVISFSDVPLEGQLSRIREEFRREVREYPQSFSYGISSSARYDNGLAPMANVSAILEETDSTMYRYKTNNRAQRKA